MTTITVPRELLEQAVNALLRGKFELRGVTATQDMDEAAQALRAALAAAPIPPASAPDGRPTVWMVRRHDAPKYWIPFMHKPVDAMKDPEREVVRLNWPAAPTQQAGEPVAWRIEVRFTGACDWNHYLTITDGKRADAMRQRFTGDGMESRVVPLYAHPAPTPPEQDDARDAARYRWLRENNGSHLTKEPVQVSILRKFEDGEVYFVHAIHGLDAAIDAAMKEPT